MFYFCTELPRRFGDGRFRREWWMLQFLLDPCTLCTEVNFSRPSRSCRVLGGPILEVMVCKDSGGVGYLKKSAEMVL